MPYKDPEKRKAAQREAQRKRRAKLKNEGKPDEDQEKRNARQREYMRERRKLEK